MTTSAPMTPSQEDRRWIERALDEAPLPAAARRDGDGWVRWCARVNKLLAIQRASSRNLVEAMGRQLAGMRREIATLRAELDTARRLDAITARLDQLEGALRAGPDAKPPRLRVASNLIG